MTKLKDLVPKPKTRVVFIIDRSGSMCGMEKFVIDTYNEQLFEIRKNAETQDITVTTTLFDGEVKIIEFDTPITEVDKLTNKTYSLGGSTALNDAIGMTIDKFRRLDDFDEEDLSYLVIIVTDGGENASKEYKTKTIAGYVKDLEGKGNWTFTYFGEEYNSPELDTITTSYGFSTANSTTGSLGMITLDDGSSLTIPSFESDFTVRSTSGITNYFSGRSRGVSATKDYYAEALPSDENGDTLEPQTKIKVDSK
jgi:uncharacterized protein YegL